MMIIYKVTNIKNNKVYIGQTVRSLKSRMQEHLRHSGTYFDNCYNLKHLNDFIVEIIDTANTIDELNEKEKYYIKKYNSIKPNGYNMCNGGENTIGFKHSEESKQKMSRAKKDKYLKENNHYFGKKHSIETREKMKKAWDNRKKYTPELVQEMVKRTQAKHFHKKVICIETGITYNSIKEAARGTMCKDTHITRVCKGKRKMTGGYHWKYVE